MDCRYIVNADDFGLSRAVNNSIDFCFKNGIISSTTILANALYFDDAVRLAEEGEYSAKVGLHFNLIEGQPITEDIKHFRRFCDEKGNFIYKRNSVFFLRKDEKRAIIKEVEAQIEKVRDAGITISHLDSHQHVHTELPIFMAIKNTLKQKGINKVRRARRIKNGNIYNELYKWLYNKILKFLGFTTTDQFNGIFDYPGGIESCENSCVELYVHPTFIDNNKLWDHVLNREIEQININMISYNEL